MQTPKDATQRHVLPTEFFQKPPFGSHHATTPTFLFCRTIRKMETEVAGLCVVELAAVVLLLLMMIRLLLPELRDERWSMQEGIQSSIAVPVRSTNQCIDRNSRVIVRVSDVAH